MSDFRHTLHVFLTLMAASAVLHACESDVVYTCYNHTPIEGWDNSDTLFFNVPAQKESGHFQLEIGLRTNNAFPFTGLSIVVRQTVMPKNKTFTDTLRCNLSDEKGNILGQGTSFFHHKFILSEICLDKGDSLHVSISHVMRCETLPGISDVGLKITKK